MLAEVETHRDNFEDALNIDNGVKDWVGLNNEPVDWCHVLVVCVVLGPHQHRVEQDACDDEPVKPLLVNQPYHVESEPRVVVVPVEC